MDLELSRSLNGIQKSSGTFEEWRRFTENKQKAIQTMAEFLEKGRIFFADHVVERISKSDKKFEMDASIVGKWRGEEVIVFVAVNHSFAAKSKRESSMASLKRTLDYWKELIDIRLPKKMHNIDNFHQVQDFSNMEIMAHGHRKVMVGFGAADFPDEVLEHFKNMPPWFRIKGSPDGHFVITLEDTLSTTDVGLSSMTLESDSTSSGEDLSSKSIREGFSSKGTCEKLSTKSTRNDLSSNSSTGDMSTDYEYLSSD